MAALVLAWLITKRKPGEKPSLSNSADTFFFQVDWKMSAVTFPGVTTAESDKPVLCQEFRECRADIQIPKPTHTT